MATQGLARYAVGLNDRTPRAPLRLAEGDVRQYVDVPVRLAGFAAGAQLIEVDLSINLGGSVLTKQVDLTNDVLQGQVLDTGVSDNLGLGRVLFSATESRSVATAVRAALAAGTPLTYDVQAWVQSPATSAFPSGEVVARTALTGPVLVVDEVSTSTGLKGTTPTAPPAQVIPASFTLSPSGALSITDTTSGTIVATVIDTSSQPAPGITLSVSSSDPAKASAPTTVTTGSTGQASIPVTGHAAGSTVVEVGVPGYGGIPAQNRTVNVAATTVPVASVTVTPNPVTVAVGATVALTATPRDAGGTALTGRGAPTWSTANSAIATVDSGGVVSGAGTGSTSISATIEGKTGSTTVTVPAAVVPTGSPFTTEFEWTGDVLAAFGNPSGWVVTTRDILTDQTLDTTAANSTLSAPLLRGTAQDGSFSVALGMNTASLAGVGYGDVVLRYADANNYTRLRLSGTSILAQDVVGGTATTRATFTAAIPDLHAITRVVTIRAVFVGTGYTVAVDGLQVGTFTTSRAPALGSAGWIPTDTTVASMLTAMTLTDSATKPKLSVIGNSHVAGSGSGGEPYTLGRQTLSHTTNPAAYSYAQHGQVADNISGMLDKLAPYARNELEPQRSNLAVLTESTNSLAATGSGSRAYTLGILPETTLLGLMLWAREVQRLGAKVALCDCMEGTVPAGMGASLNAGIAATSSTIADAVVKFSETILGPSTSYSAHPEVWSDAGVHPNAAGYAILGAKAAPVVDAMNAASSALPPLLFNAVAAKARWAVDPRFGNYMATKHVANARRGPSLFGGVSFADASATPTVTGTGAKTMWGVTNTVYLGERDGLYFASWAQQMMRDYSGFNLTFLLYAASGDPARTGTILALGNGENVANSLLLYGNGSGGLMYVVNNLDNGTDTVTAPAGTRTVGYHVVSINHDRTQGVRANRNRIVVDGTLISTTPTSSGADASLPKFGAQGLFIGTSDPAGVSSPTGCVSGIGAILGHAPLTLAEDQALHAQIAAAGWTGT